MNNVYTKETFLDAYRGLLRAAAELGFPDEVGKMLAKELHSESAIRRMTSYLKLAHPRSMEDVADEMVAIIEERERRAEKRKYIENNSAYNDWLNSDMREQ